MSKYREFDWFEAEYSRSATHIAMLKSTHKLKLTWPQFLKIYRSYYPGRAGLHKPRQTYQNCKEHFGFFTGELS